jgi:hypothetical protein
MYIYTLCINIPLRVCVPACPGHVVEPGLGVERASVPAGQRKPVPGYNEDGIEPDILKIVNDR